MDNTYMDLAARLEDSFPDIENEVIVDLRENNEDYAALRGKISDIENKHGFIEQVLNGSGEICLTTEEHTVLTEYLRLRFNLDDMERKALYLTDDGLLRAGSEVQIPAEAGIVQWGDAGDELVQHLFIDGRAGDVQHFVEGSFDSGHIEGVIAFFAHSVDSFKFLIQGGKVGYFDSFANSSVIQLHVVLSCAGNLL